jgi:N-glycosidase YbiA
MDLILIRLVKDINGWLSCMWACLLTFKGLEFRTPEALFQWLRFAGHPVIQKEILDQKSPMGAKMRARKHCGLLNRGPKWDQAPEDIPRMKMVMLLKLEQHPELKDKLISTGTATIIEDCTSHDRESARFWGMVYKDGKWTGENNLGKIWMEIRCELQKTNN